LGIFYHLPDIFSHSYDFQELKMDYWTKCKDNASICVTGFLVGLILTFLLVFIYMKWFKAENFTDPNDLDPATKALLAYHLASDPIGLGASAFYAPKNERFVDPNSMSPATKAILAAHMASDPIGLGASAFYKKPERLENKRENPALVNILYGGSGN
jgi:hypothetical protein